jgi:glycosyltransferase involved in cell wall biosynthesis
MSETLVSIIVPVYNVEKYLKVCLESIINQTYRNIEIILVNDGSTDYSLEICKLYAEKESRILLIDKKNEGLSSARQKGIENAKGEFFCTVDSDDYIEENFVEKMLKKIINEESDICVCATREYTKNESKVRGFSPNIESPEKITLNKIEKSYKTLLSKYYMSDSWNKIYRMDFVRNSNVKFTLSKDYNGTDLLFNHLLFLYLPKISVLNEPLYNYQIVENSRVRRKNKQLQKGFFIIMEKIIAETEKLGYSNKLNNQLSELYVSLQRYAAQDIFNADENFNVMRNKIKEFIKENNNFLHKNIVLNLNTKHFSSFSNKIFSLCLKSRNSIIIIYYLKCRKKLLVRDD